MTYVTQADCFQAAEERDTTIHRIEFTSVQAASNVRLTSGTRHLLLRFQRAGIT